MGLSFNRIRALGYRGIQLPVKFAMKDKVFIPREKNVPPGFQGPLPDPFGGMPTAQAFGQKGPSAKTYRERRRERLEAEKRWRAKRRAARLTGRWKLGEVGLTGEVSLASSTERRARGRPAYPSRNRRSRRPRRDRGADTSPERNARPYRAKRLFPGMDERRNALSHVEETSRGRRTFSRRLGHDRDLIGKPGRPVPAAGALPAPSGRLVFDPAYERGSLPRKRSVRARSGERRRRRGPPGRWKKKKQGTACRALRAVRGKGRNYAGFDAERAEEADAVVALRHGDEAADREAEGEFFREPALFPGHLERRVEQRDPEEDAEDAADDPDVLLHGNPSGFTQSIPGTGGRSPRPVARCHGRAVRVDSALPTGPGPAGVKGGVMDELFRELAGAVSVPGNEDEVRDILARELSPHGQVSTTRHGDLLFERPGGAPSPRVAVCCHMDSPGFIVMEIRDDGLCG
jgi:hypothetical protein